MNINLIVLTCDKYLDTRVKSIKETFGQELKMTYLTDSSIFNDGEIVGFDTPQNYSGIQAKYYNFFLNYDFSNSDYFFFIDDDTFVIKKNLFSLDLPSFDESFCLSRICRLNPDATDYHGNYTGYPLHTIVGQNSELPLDYPSGGSGFIMSKTACLNVQNYLKNTDVNIVQRSGHSDVTVGFWMRSSGVKVILCDQFWWEKPENLFGQEFWPFNEDSESKAVTFHYVNESLMSDFNKKYNLV
jgi:hypothetical protein